MVTTGRSRARAEFRAVDPRGQELAERLDAVVEPVRSRGLDPRPGCRGAKLVALGPVTGLERRGVADLHGDVARAQQAGDGGQPVAGRGAQVSGQVAGDRQLSRGVSACGGDDPGVPGEGEAAAAELRGYRFRHDVERGGRSGRARRCRAGGRAEDGGGNTGREDRQAHGPGRQERQAAAHAATAGAAQPAAGASESAAGGVRGARRASGRARRRGLRFMLAAWFSRVNATDRCGPCLARQAGRYKRGRDRVKQSRPRGAARTVIYAGSRVPAAATRPAGAARAWLPRVLCA